MTTKHTAYLNEDLTHAIKTAKLDIAQVIKSLGAVLAQIEEAEAARREGGDDAFCMSLNLPSYDGSFSQPAAAYYRLIGATKVVRGMVQKVTP